MLKSSMLECVCQSNLPDRVGDKAESKKLSGGESMKLWNRLVLGSLVLTLALGVCVSPAAAASKKKKKEEKKE